jgi:hypothetical protein
MRGLSLNPGGLKNFIFFVIQTAFGVYPMGTRDFFLGDKAARPQAAHSHPASAKVKKMWIYTSTPPYAFMA